MGSMRWNWSGERFVAGEMSKRREAVLETHLRGVVPEPWTLRAEDSGEEPHGHGERLLREGTVSSRSRRPVWQRGHRSGGGGKAEAAGDDSGRTVRAGAAGVGTIIWRERSRREWQAGLKMP